MVMVYCKCTVSENGGGGDGCGGGGGGCGGGGGGGGGSGGGWGGGDGGGGGSCTTWPSTSRIDTNATWVEELILENWQVTVHWSNTLKVTDWYHRNEEVEMVVHECLQMQECYFCPQTIFKVIPRWHKLFGVLEDSVEDWWYCGEINELHLTL